MQNSQVTPQQTQGAAANQSLSTPTKRSRRHLAPLFSRGVALIVVLTLMLLNGRIANAQALPTAKRAGDLQVGGGFSLAKPDYTQQTFRGFSFYSSFDFKEHFGIEVDFHQMNHGQTDNIYERSYEVGGRYVRHYGIFNPYARLMYGRGVFNYPYDVANLAYNMGVAGAGVDINVSRRVNVRADYEYQRWFGFRGYVSGNPNGANNGPLTPQIFTIGAAYHFQ